MTWVDRGTGPAPATRTTGAARRGARGPDGEGPVQSGLIRGELARGNRARGGVGALSPRGRVLADDQEREGWAISAGQTAAEEEQRPRRGGKVREGCSEGMGRRFHQREPAGKQSVGM